MTKTAKNQQILKIASKIARAMEDETEAILLDTEALVKKYFPARYTKSALKKIEASLDDNGIEAAFDKTVEKEAFKRTASVAPTARELHEACDHIAKASLDEMEAMLKDANEVVNSVLNKFAAAERPEIEAKLKNLIESNFRRNGVYFKFDRVTYSPEKAMQKAAAAIAASQKKVVAQKSTGNRILDAMRADA